MSEPDPQAPAAQGATGGPVSGGYGLWDAEAEAEQW